MDAQIGPLAGIKVLEFGGIGPVPFCGMLLADMGAHVLRLTHPSGDAWPNGITERGKTCAPADLKQPGTIAHCIDLIREADVLIEGYRPGVMERLGLGPDVAHEANPRLVYGRLTGWGQEGPLAHTAGHDLTYIAVTGILAAMGPASGVPVPPLNLVGDFGGGSLYLAMGIAAALFARHHTGRGQVIDAAIIDGASSLFATAAGYAASGQLSRRRGNNVLDGSCPYYRCYECADGQYVAVGAVEPEFYNLLLRLIGVSAEALGPRDDPACWPSACEILAGVFRRKSRDEWCELLEGTDACVAPVLDFDEAHAHRQMHARGVLSAIGDLMQPMPAPRFSMSGHKPIEKPVHADSLAQAAELWGRARQGLLF